MDNMLENMFSDFFGYKKSFFTDLQKSMFLPYNLYQKDDLLTFEMACAGYDKSNLDLEYQDGYLKVKGEIPMTGEPITFTHKGISSKSFNFTFPIPLVYIFDKAIVKNGILKVTFKKQAALSKPAKLPLSEE